MAVIEIAKIQVRRGQENQTGIPQLDGGEFAWAADTESLYIGLRREDGGARDTNVRVLTENDLRNFFAVNYSNAGSGAYIYRSGTDITVYNSGTIVQTEWDPFAGDEVVRTLQDRLDDDHVSIKNFGVSGDGGDNTQSDFIQLAVDRLFLSTDTHFSLDGNIIPPAKVLFFPAGNYAVTGTIYIPENTTIVGEGIDKTIFTLMSDGEHVFQTVDSGGRRDDPVSMGIFTSSGTTINYATRPKNIHIEGLTIKYATTSETTLTGGTPLISLDCADNALIRRVKFEGNYDEDTVAENRYAGADVRGYAGIMAATSQNVVFEDCEFKGLYSGVTSNFDVDHIVIQNSNFYKMERGVNFNDPVSSDGFTTIGPRYCKIINNKFQDIQSEAIYAGPGLVSSSSGIVSMGNTFINVGNGGYNEMYSTGTSIITFLSNGNTSLNDNFERLEWQTQNGGVYTYNPLVRGRAILDSFAATTATAFQNATTVLMRLPITNEQQHLTLKYTCYADLGTSDTVDRMGTVTYYIKEGNDPEVIISDNFNAFSSDGGLFWAATVDDGYKFIEISVVNPNIAYGGTGYDVQIEFQSKLMI